jgi:predicted RecB family nuclease
VLAATDLTEFLACQHLAQQRLAVVREERGRPRPADDPHADLIRGRGEAHEQEQLERLSAECGGHVDLSAEIPRTREALESRAVATEQAMREGAPLIYQAQFFDGHWQGRVDFLRRISMPSSLGEFAYEVIDTKLARQVKPQVIHQLSLYNRLVDRLQGFEPEEAHLLLGDGSSQASICGSSPHCTDMLWRAWSERRPSRGSLRTPSPLPTARSVLYRASATPVGSPTIT